MPRRREERGLRSGGTVTRSAHVMSSRIRGRRYRNIDPDERYGFVVGSPRPPAPSEPTIVAIDPSGGARDGTTVVMDDTAVTVEPGAVILQSQSVVLEPRVVTGPQQVEG